MTRLPLFLLVGLALTVPTLPLRPATPDPAVRIALLADPHSTRGTKDDQPLYRGRLDRVIAAVNAAHVDLVLIAGDLTQGGRDEEYDDFLAQTKAFQAPVLVTPGNHDLGQKAGVPGSTGPTAARLARYEHKLGPSFYATDRAGLRIISVNSPILGSGLPAEARMWEFLETELARPSPLPRVVFTHYPPFVKRADEPGGDYFNLEPAPRAHLLDLLHRAGVTTLLTGHLHYPLVNRSNGLLIVTTLPVSFGLPQGKQPEGWTLVTVPRAPGAEATWEFQTIKD